MLRALEHVVHERARTLGPIAHRLGGVVQAGVPLASLLSEGVRATAGAVGVLLEDENSLAALREQVGAGTTAAATADDDGVKLRRDELGTEGAGADGTDLADLLPGPGDVQKEKGGGQNRRQKQEYPEAGDEADGPSLPCARSRIPHNLVRHGREHIVHDVLVL